MAPSGRSRRQLLRQTFREFWLVPVLVVACFAVLSALSVLADEGNLPVLDGLRHAAGHVVGSNAASTALQAIASGLVTVTSITFSVLLLAVQQTASNLSPVVFDQFIRRHTNQAFLGFFVGLALFAFVVLAAVRDKTPPILGASIATVLTVVAILVLLVLVFSVVDQMRPTNVLRAMHDRTLAARTRESELVRRTRRVEQGRDPVKVTYRADRAGYLNSIDLHRIEKALQEDRRTEVVLHATLGAHVALHEVLVTVRDDDDATAEDVARQVRSALVIGAERDLDYDATTGIDELGNIAWTSASSAKHNPEVARQALEVLRDLAARWLVDDPAREPAADPLPVVYADNDLSRLFDVVFAVVVAAQESHQHMTAARVLDIYASLLPLVDGDASDRLCRDIAAALGVAEDIPAAPMLDDAAARLREALAEREVR